MQRLFSQNPNRIFFEMVYRPEKCIISQGGQSSGKTWGAMQWAWYVAISDAGSVTTCVGHSVPHLDKGCLRDFLSIMRIDPHLKAYLKSYNKNKKTFTFYNGSVVEFASYENEMSARGAKRDYLFVNEANGIGYEIFKNLYDRTRKKCVIDFNPTSEFWAHTEVWRPVKKIGGEAVLNSDGSEVRETRYLVDEKGVRVKRKVEVLNANYEVVGWEVREIREAVLLKTNWRNNRRFLSADEIAKIERYKDQDPERYKVYGLGEIGKIDGLVYKNFRLVKSVPYDRVNEVIHALDFGGGTAATAMVSVYFEAYKALDSDGVERIRQRIYIQERLYNKTIMSNQSLADHVVRAIKRDVVVCDNNELIYRELVAKGVSAMKVKKWPGSVEAGIKAVNDYDEICVTSDSPNVWKEINNYCYEKDKDGRVGGTPIDTWNDAMDAMRYAVMSRGRMPKRFIYNIEFGGYPENMSPEYRAKTGM